MVKIWCSNEYIRLSFRSAHCIQLLYKRGEITILGHNTYMNFIPSIYIYCSNVSHMHMSISHHLRENTHRQEGSGLPTETTECQDRGIF